MRKIFYGTITFLYLLVASNYGTGISTGEFLKSLFSGRPTDVGTLIFSLMIAVIVAYKTSNEIKKITILNIVSILVLGGLFMMGLHKNQEIKAERKDTISKNILQDVTNASEAQVYKSIERYGGVLRYIKEMSNGTNKTIRANDGRIAIDSTTFMTAAQVRDYIQIYKFILIKPLWIAEYAKANNTTDEQMEKAFETLAVREEVLEQYKAANINAYCPITFYNVLFKEKLIMEFVYHYDDGELFGSYTIDYGDCQQSNLNKKK